MATDVNDEILETLEWMIQTFIWQRAVDEPDPNPEWGRDPNLSPEMQKAVAIYQDIKYGRIVCVRTST